MTRMVQAAGILLILSAVWLRAESRLTVNYAAFWGMTGILLAAMGGFPPLSGWIDIQLEEALTDGSGWLLCVAGAAALTGGITASLCLSRRSVKRQELAIRRSLLPQEEERTFEKMDEADEKASLCSQCGGISGGRDSLAGIAEEHK